MKSVSDPIKRNKNAIRTWIACGSIRANGNHVPNCTSTTAPIICEIFPAGTGVDAVSDAFAMRGFDAETAVGAVGARVFSPTLRTPTATGARLWTGPAAPALRTANRAAARNMMDRECKTAADRKRPIGCPGVALSTVMSPPLDWLDHPTDAL